MGSGRRTTDHIPLPTSFTKAEPDAVCACGGGGGGVNSIVDDNSNCPHWLPRAAGQYQP